MRTIQIPLAIASPFDKGKGDVLANLSVFRISGCSLLRLLQSRFIYLTYIVWRVTKLRRLAHSSPAVTYFKEGLCIGAWATLVAVFCDASLQFTRSLRLEIYVF